MSVATEYPTTSTAYSKTAVTRPMSIVVCCGAMVTVIATAIAGSEALVVSALGTLLMLVLFGMTHLFDWVLSTVASLKAAVAEEQTYRDINKRFACSILIRAAFAMAAIALAIRHYGVDSKLVVAIALPLYCGLLLAEVACVVARQSKNTSCVAKQNPSLQARI